VGKREGGGKGQLVMWDLRSCSRPETSPCHPTWSGSVAAGPFIGREKRILAFDGWRTLFKDAEQAQGRPSASVRRDGLGGTTSFRTLFVRRSKASASQPPAAHATKDGLGSG